MFRFHQLTFPRLFMSKIKERCLSVNLLCMHNCLLGHNYIEVTGDCKRNKNHDIDNLPLPLSASHLNKSNQQIPIPIKLEIDFVEFLYVSHTYIHKSQNMSLCSTFKIHVEGQKKKVCLTWKSIKMTQGIEFNRFRFSHQYISMLKKQQQGIFQAKQKS